MFYGKAEWSIDTSSKVSCADTKQHLRDISTTSEALSLFRLRIKSNETQIIKEKWHRNEGKREEIHRKDHRDREGCKLCLLYSSLFLPLFGFFFYFSVFVSEDRYSPPSSSSSSYSSSSSFASSTLRFPLPPPLCFLAGLRRAQAPLDAEPRWCPHALLATSANTYAFRSLFHFFFNAS